ncbi:MAG: alpha/beta fold hydrolase [Spirochaetes bacterium]|nr:MAG: alpha/beta fold hydrolase [Spirochaetota bacterium]
MKLLKYIGIFAAVVVGLLALLTGYAAVKNSILSSKWRAALPVNGKLVDAGTTKLCIIEKGTASPAVIIETGLGSTAAEWAGVQDALSKRARVILYERAGYGHSGDAQGARAPEAIVNELKFALEKEGITPPYVIVGHDIGALYAEYFARTDPFAVVGVVLVDPLPLNFERFKKELDPGVYNNFIDRTPGLQMGRAFAAMGAMRALSIVPYRTYPSVIKQDLVEAWSQSRFYETMVSEYRKGFREGSAKLAEAGPFPKIPLVVIEHSPKLYHDDMMFWGVPVDQARKIETITRDAYDRYLKLSPRAERIVSAKSMKNIHFDEPELLVRIVDEMVQRFR